ncbi:hypothetical protein BBJ28_00006023 [Nothophytophthora sp. Chile5]|nr:hypothetical protein BBJ28_00006023 [Nothophytophthora sp. Chile5]
MARKPLFPNVIRLARLRKLENALQSPAASRQHALRPSALQDLSLDSSRSDCFGLRKLQAVLVISGPRTLHLGDQSKALSNLPSYNNPPPTRNMSAAKTVLITGSNRGIGLAFAKHYVTNGWKVIAAARDLQSANELKALKVARTVQLDTSDEASITAAAEQLEGEPIDLVINNAGIGIGGDMDKTSKAEMMQQFEINTVGPFLVTRALLPNLKLAADQNGSATVGQVTSRMGCVSDNGSGGMYGYRASKCALNMVNASLAVDLKHDKIIALALHPGYVSTRMTGNSGAVLPEESVAGMTKIIAAATAADSGKLFHFQGAELPWHHIQHDDMAAKTVLITGSTRGIGLEFAKHYTNAGWKVIGVTRGGSNCDRLKALSPFKIVTLDATDESTIVKAAKELEGIPVDLLVNNAGIYIGGDLKSTTKDELMRQFEVNTVGPFLVTRALLPNLKLAAETAGSAGARVVTVSSLMGSIANNTGGNYSYNASKAAVNMVNSSLAIDLKKDNIAAIVVHPGYVVTDLTGGLGDVHTDESVAGMTAVIEKVTMTDTGKFFHFQGHEIAW